MTIGQRLLALTTLLVVVTTLLLGIGLREAWRRTELRQFSAQFQNATDRLRVELGKQTSGLPGQVTPICQNPVVDSALVDLQTGSLDSGRRLALSLRVEALLGSLPLDELILISDHGEILGAGHDKALIGTRDRERAANAKRLAGHAGYAEAEQVHKIESSCVLARGERWVAIYAARYLDTLLRDVSATHGIPLRIGEVRKQPSVMELTLRLKELGNLNVIATRSRVPLNRALAELDATVLLLGIATLLLALGLSWLISRGISRPIVELAAQAQASVGREPQPVRARGGRELAQLASSFNQAISDLAALRRRLAASERIAARREIAQRVAHEIKNPLAPIRAAVETLRRLRARNDPAFDEYFDEASRTVLNEVARITTIVQQFTRFARLPPPQPSPMDLGDVVREVVGLHNTGKVRITLEAGDLPEVYADRDQMVQVVTNLLQNAMDAVEHQETPHVDVRLEAHDATLMLKIVDNGPGVPPEMVHRLFEPYATTKGEGTGLGLAIVQRIVVEHGGEIRFRNLGPPGPSGAEFSVQLPLDARPSEADSSLPDVFDNDRRESVR